MHVSDAPAARLDDGHVIADSPPIGSVTVTGFRVSSPVFVTKYEYVIFVPAAEYEATDPDFTSVTAGLSTVSVVDPGAFNPNRPPEVGKFAALFV